MCTKTCLHLAWFFNVKVGSFVAHSIIIVYKEYL